MSNFALLVVKCALATCIWGCIAKGPSFRGFSQGPRVNITKNKTEAPPNAPQARRRKFWTVDIEGDGRCSAKNAFDLRDSTLIATVNLGEVQGHVTAAFYLVAGGDDDDEGYYCDAQGLVDHRFCNEIDLLETNGYYSGGSNLHTFNTNEDWYSTNCEEGCDCDAGGECETALRFCDSWKPDIECTGNLKDSAVTYHRGVNCVKASTNFYISVKFDSKGNLAEIKYNQTSAQRGETATWVDLYPRGLSPKDDKLPSKHDQASFAHVKSWVPVFSLWQDSSWPGPGNCDNDWGSLHESRFKAGDVKIYDKNGKMTQVEFEADYGDNTECE